MSPHSTSGLPPSDAAPIRIRAHDLSRLEAMLQTPAYRQHPGAAALQHELDRAELLPAGDDAPDIVGMHARVDCVDDQDGAHHRLTLVYPHEADPAAGRVSILAPVGSALLGLAVGQTIEWPSTNGRTLHLRVLAVTPPAA